MCVEKYLLNLQRTRKSYVKTDLIFAHLLRVVTPLQSHDHTHTCPRARR